MPNNQTNEDSKLIDRDREVDEILEESKYLLDQEKMELTAQKYRAKQPVAEIFSNADKKPRLENSNPLDVDKEQTVNENEISGDKTATTLQAELVLEGTDDDYPSPQNEILKETEKNTEQDKDEKSEEKQETALEENKSTEQTNSDEKTDTDSENEDDEEIVTLTPEYSEGTTFSQDILDDVDQFNDNETHIKSIHTIDIDITDDDTKPPKAPNEPQGKFDELFKTPEPDVKQHKKVIAKVPVYRKEGEQNALNVKAGKFSEVVGYEYEEYIKSKNPSVIAHVIKPETKRTVIVEEDDDEVEPLDFHSASEKIMSSLVGFFSKDASDDNDTPVKETEVVDDYMGEDDEKSIMQEINLNIKKLFGRTMLTGGLALVSIIITVLVRLFPQAICNAVFFAPVAYAVINFLLIGFSTFVNRVSIMSGLTPLTHFKGNSDTAVALAAVASVIQTVVSFFCLYGVTGFDINYYTVIVLVAFFANNLGKLLMVLRVKENFKFTAADGQRYAAKIYNNESVATQMMSGTAVEQPIIAYQHRTGFPSNFLKISYAPDPSEDLASKLAPATSIIAVVVALLYGIFFGSFSGAQKTMVNESENKVSNLKSYGKKCSSTLKSLLMTFRLKGSNAFKIALKATKFDLLVKEGAKLNHSASETFKASAERTKLLSKELGGVRHSAANAVAVLAGKDVTEAPKHLDNDKGLLHLIEKGFTGLSQKCDKMGSLADNLSDKIGYRYMKISAEQKDILTSEGYKEFSQSDDGNYIIKYPAEEKNNIIKIVNNQNNTMKNVR